MKHIAFGCSVVGAALGGFLLRSALAATPTSPMTYTGRLTNNGQPLNSTSEIVVVRLFDDATAGMARCQSDSVTGVPVVDGRFRVNLNAGCATALATYGELWVEVEYPSGNFFPRTKVGAVPYAVEALRAETVANVQPFAAQKYMRIGDIQVAWGTAVTGATGYVPVDIPAFLDSSYAVTATAGDAGSFGGHAEVQIVTNSSINLQFSSGGNLNGRTIHWTAMGRWR